MQVATQTDGRNGTRAFFGRGVEIREVRSVLYLHGVSGAVELSRATMKNIRQNLFFAFFYNALSIPLAAGLFYPLTGWLLNPMIASVAMALSSLSVLLNALRLRRFEPGK